MSENPRSLAADFCVVGGGMAGVCAALAAARHGSRTVLVQNRPVLGGNSSSEIRVHVTGADAWHPGFREGGILEELRLEESVRNPTRLAEVWDLILWEKVTAEPKLTLLLNTQLTGVESSPAGTISAVQAVCLTTEEELEIAAPLFCDCTGHGTLGAWAGADFRHGREGPEEHGEPDAEGPDAYTMGASLKWCARDTGQPVRFVAPTWARKFNRAEDLPHRLGPGLSLERGHWWIEYGGELDTVRDAEVIRDELLACLMGVWDWVKNHSELGAENWELTWFGFLPGHRESRRLMGPYILTENDLLENRSFPDAVAHGGWPIDTHPPGGIFSPEPPCTFLHPSAVYSIPLRCLYSRKVPNLMMAGRDASCTHMAMASTRVMGTCAVMGQAAGTAAALCREVGRLPHEMTPELIRRLQQILLRDDQFIPGVADEDPEDLARQASLSASSAAEGCPAAAAADGLTRELEGASHQWRSAEGEELPQWLELAWGAPVQAREVQLIFDSGFARPLFLTHSDSINARMIRGPQPETVRDYDLQVCSGGEWRTVHEERGNYQRRRIHPLEGRPIEALRLVAHATWGEPGARVFAVRVY